MAYVWQHWLLTEFVEYCEAHGVDVFVVEGAATRGRPASTGHCDPRGPVSKHHTGATSSATKPNPTLPTLIIGRSDLPGPLCQITSTYDGRIGVVACGRANHAGRVGRSGVIGMPLGADGNALALGDEVDTNGTQTLPPAQRRAMAVADAAILTHFGKPAEWIHRHADISGTGKWDIGSRTTAQLRDDAREVLAQDEEDDMPTPEEYAEAVWAKPVKVIGSDTDERIPAAMMLNQIHHRLARAEARLRQIQQDHDQEEPA